MLDGLELKGRCCVVALGITTDGVLPLGLWDGSTENNRVCVELLANLVDRAWTAIRACSSLDGGKALRGRRRCVRPRPSPAMRSPQRNATSSDHLPERDRPVFKRKLRAAWKLGDHEAAIERLEALASELAHSWAAPVLRSTCCESWWVESLGR